MVDVAAFDFDGTLTEGGSVMDFLMDVGGPIKVVAATAILSPRLAHGALAGGTVADQSKELLFQRVLAGEEAPQVEALAEVFAERHLSRHLRTELRERWERHRQRGDRLVIVSASPDVYVAAAGRLLGADGVVATRLAVDDQGALTGRYEGANCRGAEKLRRLRVWIDEDSVVPERLWAYGNSRGDLRMLDAADVGVNVGRLGRFGRLRGFPGLDGAPLPG